MGDWKTHFQSGFLILILAVVFYLNDLIDLGSLLISIPIILIFSVLADVDSYSSKIRTLILVSGLILIFLTIYLDVYSGAYLLIGILIFLALQRHRGFLHTVIAALIFSIPIFLILGFYISLLSFSAYSLHLIIDKILKFV